jgi:hypothetical protein
VSAKAQYYEPVCSLDTRANARCLILAFVRRIRPAHHQQLNGDLMRAILVAFLVFVSVPASAMSWNGPQHGAVFHNSARAMHDSVWHWHQKKMMVRVANTVTGGPHRLSGECRIASSRGGPCGCYASEVVFGHSVRNLWRADAWLKFPRTTPHAGAVAVWPGRHVARVVANNGDGTITVADSWATHRVRVAGLVFVDPRGQ